MNKIYYLFVILTIITPLTLCSDYRVVGVPELSSPNNPYAQPTISSDLRTNRLTTRSQFSLINELSNSPLSNSSALRFFEPNL